MKKVGLVGGIGPESTISYYHDIVYGVQKEVGRDFFPDVSIESIALFKWVDLCDKKEYDKLADYTMEHLRDAVSVVLQKNTLFSGTIRENLLWGDPNATEEQLWAACRAACADEFLERMPDGLDTDLGQGGVNVSGGQKQRLCIARAILKQPKVLILDDSTSAVDTATDAKIRKAFANELGDTTKIVIAQRVTSICEADLILVMDGGRIVAQGTHDELMNSCDIYREVYQSQQEGVSIGG